MVSKEGNARADGHRCTSPDADQHLSDFGPRGDWPKAKRPAMAMILFAFGEGFHGKFYGGAQLAPSQVTEQILRAVLALEREGQG